MADIKGGRRSTRSQKRSSMAVKGVKDSAQSEVDVTMEYRIKYERLVSIMSEVNKEYLEQQKHMQTHKEAFEELLKELKDDLFKKEDKLFRCEEELAQTKVEIERLKQELEQEKTKSANVTATNLNITMKKDGERSRVWNKRLSNISDISRIDYDRASPLLTPETPRGISRTKRLSAIRKAIDDAVPQDSEDREERLKQIILDQKEILDCYSMLTGLSGWKEPPPTPELESSNPSPDVFHFKIQMLSDLDGLEFQLAVDYEFNDMQYEPTFLADMDEAQIEKMLPFLKTKLYFSTEHAPKLLKRLLFSTAE